jgi:XTP/dITP diphosphohydrolase
VPSPAKLVVASSNPGKLREYRALAAGHPTELQLFPEFDSLPPFEEIYPTFAENAAGKALHFSRHISLPVLADDSGLVVPALGGAPGPKRRRPRQKIARRIVWKNWRRAPRAVRLRAGAG